MRRRNLYLFLAVLLLIVGFRIATYSFPMPASRAGAHATPLYDYKGLIHVHTTYSDGAGTVEEVAATGNRLGIDFLISTDHNTLQPLIDQKEGWYDHLLFLSGEEIGMDGEYTLALGISKTVKGKDREPQAVVDEVRQQGGMAFISHPLHPRSGWVNWGTTGVTGMEIIDAAFFWQKANSLTLLWSLMTYPLNPSYAFLNLYQRPQDVLEKWDEQTQTERVVGIYSADIHGQFRIRKRYHIKFPPPQRVMRLASNHVLLREPFKGDLAHDRKMLYDAIREGHLYFAMDLLGDPTGFLFQGTTGSGERVLMGDELTKKGPVTLTASLGEQFHPESYRIKLFKDGLLVADSSTTPLVFEAKEEGVYRIEVELHRRSPFLIDQAYAWIYSNPIYLRGTP
ncbi:MAG: PHP domain-containing protein [Nitrospirae bacterium]|nr:PHP domain-containing protein [Nitrospirota bacterium]